MKTRSVLLLTGVCAMLLIPIYGYAFTFEVYGYASDESTQNAAEFFRDLDGIQEVNVYDATELEIGKRYQDLTNFITVRCDVPLLPKSVERRTAPPFVHNQNRDRYYAQYMTPLVGMFYSGELVAVVLGWAWYGPEYWIDLVADSPSWSGLLIHTLAGEHHIENRELIHEFALLFLGG